MVRCSPLRSVDYIVIPLWDYLYNEYHVHGLSVFVIGMYISDL